MKLKLCCLALLLPCVQMFALDKIYGIVRYYSPNLYTQAWDETDWFKVAYRYVRYYRESDCDESVLYDFLNVFAPNATLTPEPDSVYSSDSGMCERRRACHSSRSEGYTHDFQCVSSVHRPKNNYFPEISA